MNVLVFDSQGTDAAAFCVSMKDIGYRAGLVRDQRTLAKALGSAQVDAVILVVSGPDDLSLIQVVRAHPSKHYIYVVVVREKESVCSLDAAYEAGCDGDTTTRNRLTIQSRLRVVERIRNHKEGAPGVDSVVVEVPRREGRFTGFQAGRRVGAPGTSHPPGAPRSLVQGLALQSSGDPVAGLSRSPTIKNFVASAAAEAGTFLGRAVRVGESEQSERPVHLAVSIVLSNVEDELEIKVILAADEPSSANLANELFSEGSEEMQQDLLSELSNILMGSLKAQLSKEQIAFTGGLPQVLPTSAWETRTREFELAVEGYLVLDGAELRVGAFIRCLKNIQVPATSLQQGMVLATDVYDAAGKFLAKSGMMLSATTAERIRTLVPKGAVVEVSRGAA